MSRLKSIGKILGWVALTITVWAAFDIWIHDYGIMPYYKYGIIESARDAYLYGFWSFAVLNIVVIAILAKAWRYLISLMLLMVSGAEDVMYYVLLPILNPARGAQLSGFMPDKLPWLNDNLWLKFFSGGEVVTKQGIGLALLISLVMLVILLTLSYQIKLNFKEHKVK